MKGSNDAANRMQVQNVTATAAFFAKVAELGFVLPKLILVMSTAELPPRGDKTLLQPPFSATFEILKPPAPPPNGKGKTAAAAVRAGGSSGAAS